MTKEQTERVKKLIAMHPEGIGTFEIISELELLPDALLPILLNLLRDGKIKVSKNELLQQYMQGGKK